MYHCDRLPIPGDPAHHCEACGNTPGKASSAHLHYTKDCPLLTPATRFIGLVTYDRILKDRHIVPEDRDGQTSQLDIDIIEAYYQLRPITPKSGPRDDIPTTCNPNHRCTNCKPNNLSLSI